MPLSRQRLAVVQVTRFRRDEVYGAFVQHLNGRVWAAAEDAGWDVIRIAAEDVGRAALLEATSDADAIVVMGGEDVSPSFYGGTEGYPGESAHYPSADEGQIALVTRALHEGTPLLGICRGAQILNVALGGTLHQHLEDDGLHRTVGVPIPEILHDHDVSITADSRLARTLGATSIPVRSAHHQAIARLGGGLTVVATAPDGVIEAVEHVRAPLTGVQWHPEDAGAAADQLPALLSALSESVLSESVLYDSALTERAA